MIGGRKKAATGKNFKRKNISSVLADVRHPSVSSFYSPHNQKPVSEKEASARKEKPRVTPGYSAVPAKQARFELKSLDASRKRRANMRFTLPVAAVLIAGLVFGAFSFKKDAVFAARETYRNFQGAISAVERYDAEGVKSSLSAADENVESIQGKTGFLSIVPVLKQIPAFIGSIRELNRSAIETVSLFDDLKKNGAVWVWGDGDKLLATLKGIKNNVSAISTNGIEVRNKMATIGFADAVSSSYLTLQSKIFGVNNLLDGVISLLEGDSYYAVFFTNDSEMRPSGGFIGSYAVLKLSGGEIDDISVNDIYYPDKFLDKKVIPPSPLQAITSNWEARDANWFFDFPTSAAKVLGFMESSSVYADKNIKFKGAMAINHKVVTDILHVTGPIELPEYKMVLDENNFLETIQEEVARDSDVRGGERKNVLKSLLPEMIKRIKEVSFADKRILTDAFAYRLKNKDIQIFSTDKRIQNFAVSEQWAGNVYEMTDAAFGDYLAVVTANLGGEKTDAYVRQKVTLQSAIDDSGYVRNEVRITRVHDGKDAGKKFYTVPNQSYVRVLVPQKSQEASSTGGMDKKIITKVNYVKEGYASDQDVMAFESGVESGKRVFGHWLTVPAGKEKTLTINYERPGVLGEKFRFVYEKQSGVDSALSYTVEAPPGYIFKETGTSEFIYNNDNPPARLIIELNLAKI